MRIPSDQKIEAQARAYSEAHTLNDKWYAEYRKQEIAFFALREPWDKIQEQCPAQKGGRCNCEQHPLWKTLYLDVIMPAHKELMAEYNIISERKYQLYYYYHAHLMSAKREKERIKAQRSKPSQPMTPEIYAEYLKQKGFFK